MTDFELDISGYAQLQEKLAELKQKGESESEYRVVANAEYAVYLEMGTRHMPPYPFFQPAIREFQASPESFVRKHTGRSFEEAESTDQVVRWVADALEAQMKMNATAGAPDRSPGTNAEHPKVQTGNLRASIRAQRIK